MAVWLKSVLPLTIVVDDFKELLGLVLSLTVEFLRGQLLGQRHKFELIELADNLSGLGRFHCAFGQVTTLIIEQTV